MEPVTEHHVHEFKCYKRRWWVLGIFCLSASSSAMQFMIYSVIADSLVKYYDITYVIAGWTSTICMISYLLFTILGSYIMDAYGFRNCALIGITVTCIGAWIKVFSIDPSRYWVLLLGQGVSASVEVLFFSLPLKLAAVWFGSNEVSTACAIGLVGVQTGITLGMLLPPLVVDTGSLEEIESGLSRLAYLVAIFTTILFVVIVVGLPDAPPTAPSLAQYNVTQKPRNFRDFLRSMKYLFSDRSHTYLLFSISTVFGSVYPIIINFNQVYTYYFPEDGFRVGYVLTLYTASSLVGLFGIGLFLDKYHAFRFTYITSAIVVTLSVILFLETIHLSLFMSYVTAIIMGIATFALFATALELGVELSYPEPQSTSSTLINSACQINGVILTYLHSYLFSYASEFWANQMLLIIIIGGNLFLFGINYNNLKRYNVERQLKDAAGINLQISPSRVEAVECDFRKTAYV